MNSKMMSTLNEIKSIITNKSSNRWLDIKEACEYTSVSHSTLRRAISKGSLKASHSTGKLLFKVEEIERWLNG